MADSDRKERFSASLRLLCAHRKSVSLAARDIGVNRQQFQKYVTGQVLPSMHMRLRIASYFELEPDDLFDPDSVADRFNSQLAVPTAGGAWQNEALSAPELARLREYQGIYHVHFVTPAFPDFVHVGVSLFRERNNAMETVFFVRSRDPVTRLLHRSHLVGSVRLRSERLFVVERSKKARDRYSETILFPTHGDRMKYMTGVSLGLTWHPKSLPYASRTIWRRAGQMVTIRQALRGCGLHAVNSPAIDPQVRSFLQVPNGDLSHNILTV